MYGNCHIRPVSDGLHSQIWHLFIYVTGYLNIWKMCKTIDFQTLVGPLLPNNKVCLMIIVSKQKRELTISQATFNLQQSNIYQTNP